MYKNKYVYLYILYTLHTSSLLIYYNYNNDSYKQKKNYKRAIFGSVHTAYTI